jgi:hypothetical protein
LLERGFLETARLLYETLLNTFLTAQFGRDERNINYGLQLILTGNKDAARAFSRDITVVGDTIESTVIIARIRKKYPNAPMPLFAARTAALLLKQSKCRGDLQNLVDLLGGMIVPTIPGPGDEGGRIVQLGRHYFQFETDEQMIQWFLIQIVPA